MRKVIMLLLLFLLVAIPVNASQFSAPEVQGEAQSLMPNDHVSFVDDVWYILKQAISELSPSIAQATAICVGLVAIVLIAAVLGNCATASSRAVQLVSTVCISTLLFEPSNAYIQLGAKTIQKLCEYGKLLLPVMTSALAAEGGITSATGLYTGTVIFNAFLSSGITKLVVPMIYIFLVVCVAENATGESVLKDLKDFVKWLITWSLKITLYLFTGYLGITGVVSGTVDASSIKATKLALSGFVPVVGGVMSDASEAILVSVGVMKNAAGIAGILAFIAIFITPFLQIGIHYILLKLTLAVCAVLGNKTSVKLIEDFTSVMGILLAMTGIVCVLHMVSTVCFMRGVG